MWLLHAHMHDNLVPEAKMAIDCAYRRFPNLCMAVTGDYISSNLTEAEMTMHIGFQNLCTTCASIPCKLDFVFISHHDKTKHNER